jgi:hypothetical protein
MVASWRQRRRLGWRAAQSATAGYLTPLLWSWHGPAMRGRWRRGRGRQGPIRSCRSVLNRHKLAVDPTRINEKALTSLDSTALRVRLPSEPGQAAAFERISRSSRSWRFSRRRRQSSSRSAVVRPPLPQPRVAFTLRHPVPDRLAAGSNSRASSSGVRPASTNSTLWRRNSGATKPEQLQSTTTRT